jgi:cell filamentation protein
LKKAGRYETSHMPEGRYEPGSRGLVLKNRLDIRSEREMDRAETEALERAEDRFFKTYGRTHQFTVADICRMHKVWLGEIYDWAGSYRQVKISKGSFSFAFPAQIPKLMGGLEEGSLRKYTPCNFESRKRIIQALAEVHVELLLIHPFREGNGRLARALATLMALQVGLPPLDFRSIKGKKKQEYFSAVRAGMDRNYKPMEKVFSEVLRKSLGTSSA